MALTKDKLEEVLKKNGLTLKNIGTSAKLDDDEEENLWILLKIFVSTLDVKKRSAVVEGIEGPLREALVGVAGQGKALPISMAYTGNELYRRYIPVDSWPEVKELFAKLGINKPKISKGDIEDYEDKLSKQQINFLLN